MARRRFFVDAISRDIAELRGDEARRLTRVLRAETGQRYEITDGVQAHLAEIAEARGDRVVFRVLEPLASEPLPVRILLCAALIKFDHFEWMVEKATELGVDRILPVNCTRTDKGLFEASQKRRDRWQRISREAVEQSRRVSPPEILPAIPFSKALAEPAAHRYFLDEAGAPPLLHLLPNPRTAADEIALLIGPEGGWTDTERSQATAADWQPASLSPQVLRAETAAAAAIAIIVNAWMRGAGSPAC